MAGSASSGMRPNQEEAIPLVFFWMGHSGWCMMRVEVWKAGKFCSSKFFILSYPKHIPVIDFLVKPEPKRVKMELVTGEGMPNWAKTNTAYLHSISVAILFSHTHKVNTWCKLNGWTVLSVWQVNCVYPCVEALCKTHTKGKNKKKSLGKAHVISTPLLCHGLDPEKHIGLISSNHP